MPYRGLGGLLLVHAALIAEPAAGRWINGAELEEHCDDFLDGTAAREDSLCLALIQGFLAGSGATQEAVRSGEASPAEAETYEERAARTRIGSRLRQMPVAEPVEYCVDENVSAVTLVEAVNAYIKSRSDSGEVTADELVREALVRNFPCDEEE